MMAEFAENELCIVYYHAKSLTFQGTVKLRLVIENIKLVIICAQARALSSFI